MSDALDSLGLRGVVAGIVPLWQGGSVAGPVRTLALRRLEEGETPPRGSHLGARTVDAAAPGDVIVVANAGRDDSAAWGGLLSAAAQRAGVAGVVVDGACRDVDEAAELGFAVFARSVTPISARGRTVEEAIDVPVAIGGVTVETGDLVIADRSGVAFISGTAADDVLAAAERIVERERSMHAELRGGATVQAVLDHRYESMLAGGSAEQPEVRGGTGAVD
ncbi:MAG TPA: demethylmenaquinone methyltransferase [Actinomycetota bacterium]|nr:demethylmenaquinone methyltransferase [Actinomycetota bacterium]